MVLMMDRTRPLEPAAEAGATIDEEPSPGPDTADGAGGLFLDRDPIALPDVVSNFVDAGGRPETVLYLAVSDEIGPRPHRCCSNSGTNCAGGVPRVGAGGARLDPTPDHGGMPDTARPASDRRPRSCCRLIHRSSAWCSSRRSPQRRPAAIDHPAPRCRCPNRPGGGAGHRGERGGDADLDRIRGVREAPRLSEVEQAAMSVDRPPAAAAARRPRAAARPRRASPLRCRGTAQPPRPRRASPPTESRTVDRRGLPGRPPDQPDC